MPTYTFQHDDASADGDVVFDGTVERDATEAWATLIAGNGTAVAFATYWAPGWQTGASTYEENYRGVGSIDTAAIGDSETVTDATWSVHGDFQQDPNGDTPTTAVYVQDSTDSETANSASDYQNVGSTKWSGDLTYAGYTDEAFNDFVFNTTGKAGINKTGKTKICMRHNFDLSGTPSTGTAQTWGIAGWATNGGASSEEDPKLVVTTTAGSTFTPKAIMF